MAETAEQQSVGEGDRLSKILSNSALIVTLVTALLYFHGRSFHDGYLAYWGLSGLFSITTENAIFSGVWTYLLLGVENWKYVLAPFLYVAALYLLMFILFSKRPLSIIRRLIESKRLDYFNEHQRMVAGEFFSGFEKVLYVLLSILCFLLITLSASTKGKELAAITHQRILSGTLEKKPFDTATVVFRDEQDRVARLSGYHIANSPELYALCTKDGVQVIPFSRILSIQLPALNPQAKTPAPMHTRTGPSLPLSNE